MKQQIIKTYQGFINWIVVNWSRLFKKKEEFSEIPLRNQYIAEIRGELIPGWVFVDIDHEEENSVKLTVSCCIPIPLELRLEFNRYFDDSFSDKDWIKIKEFILSRPEIQIYK